MAESAAVSGICKAKSYPPSPRLRLEAATQALQGFMDAGAPRSAHTSFRPLRIVLEPVVKGDRMADRITTAEET
jgi:hypothetical protein